MIQIRKSTARGHANHGWLDTWHSFSFADYYDPAEMGWGALRVINEDFVQPGKGFGTHGHRDMEIITYILSGALEHKDSMGNGEVIRPGEVQRMSAGKGVLHSEFNPSPEEIVHLLQIWIEPAVKGVPPSYEQKFFAPEERRGRLRLIASRNGREGSVTIHQDAAVYVSLLASGEQTSHALAPGRRAYLHLAKGQAKLNGNALQAGDGAKIADEPALNIAADADAELLLFDLP
ncbi:MAG: quercetin 2,3-dioxygenase [Rhodocyclaceae bacterium]|jgi:redox-sensitive bicupin YhaK (pirin superfamily)|nr:quercetin 2,3-dioxygenase [Rhodocyclaceae bacterium]